MKINETVYKKLLAQAEEAKELGFNKLADGIFGAIGSCPDEDNERYSYGQLRDDIHSDLWKIATRLMHYYDVRGVDAMKFDGVMDKLAGEVLDEMEVAMGVDNVLVGVNDEKVFGQE